jgi:hypothetical protein
MSAMSGHDHRADRGERGLLLERAREERPGADELAQPRLRALGGGARVALGVEQPLALGLALQPLRRRADERVGDGFDLADVGARVVHRLAAAERERGIAQPPDRLDDASRDPPRRHAAEAEREQDAAAVRDERLEHRDLLDRRRNADRDRPVGRVQARDRRLHAHALDRRRLADRFVAARLLHQREERGRRPLAEGALVLARARDARVAAVEDGDDPVVGDALLADDAQDRLRADDRREHVAHFAVLQHRNAHRDAELAEQAAPQRADDRCARAHDLGEALRLRGRRQLRAVLATGVEQLRAIGRGEHDRHPLGPRREDATRELIRLLQVGRRWPSRSGR